MKFTLILALASVFTGVISAPITAPEADLSVEKRQTDVNSIITTLTAAIAPQIASIESILSSSDGSTVVSDVTAQVTVIVASVDAATASLSGLAGSEAADVQAALTALLTDINGITETLVAALGLTTTLSILNPLIGSLTSLLASLTGLVSNLLALVQTIVSGLNGLNLVGLLNGLLTGLGL